MAGTIKYSSLKLTGLYGEGNLISLPEFELNFSEEIGVSIPLMTISFRVDLINQVINSITDSTILTLKIGESVSTWIVKHYSMPDESHVSIICFLNLLDFVHISKQSYYEGNSLDAVKSITSVPVITDSSAPLDSQIWIQDNISDQDYLISILTHSNLPEDNFVYYLGIDGKLYLKSYNELVKEKTWTFGSENTDLGFSKLTVESLPVSFKLKTQFSQFISSQELNVDTYKDNKTSDVTNIFTVALDCGNTHKEYFSSFNKINTRFSAMMSRLFSCKVTNTPMVHPLDVIQIDSYTENHSISDIPSIINKKFIVTKVITSIDKSRKLTQQFWFSRVES